MREFCKSGSVRGARGNPRPYRDNSSGASLRFDMTLFFSCLPSSQRRPRSHSEGAVPASGRGGQVIESFGVATGSAHPVGWRSCVRY